MTEKNAIIYSRGAADYRLRSIGPGDIDELRSWKNLNKASFFLRADITPEQQSEWFAAFSDRPGDHMFIVEQAVEDSWEKIGCMGFRLLEDEGCVDAYNIIRSHRIEPVAFNFSDPFRLMLAHAAGLYPVFPIRCKVLSENPAVSWYEKNGFAKVMAENTYFLLELDKASIAGIEPVFDV